MSKHRVGTVPIVPYSQGFRSTGRYPRGQERTLNPQLLRLPNMYICMAFHSTERRCSSPRNVSATSNASTGTHCICMVFHSTGRRCYPPRGTCPQPLMLRQGPTVFVRFLAAQEGITPPPGTYPQPSKCEMLRQGRTVFVWFSAAQEGVVPPPRNVPSAPLSATTESIQPLDPCHFK